MNETPYDREPFPPDGGRAGLGVFAQWVKREARGGAKRRLSPQLRGHTPIQPSPIEGEGFAFAAAEANYDSPALQPETAL
jgi:hypothetical protein